MSVKSWHMYTCNFDEKDLALKRLITTSVNQLYSRHNHGPLKIHLLPEKKRNIRKKKDKTKKLAIKKEKTNIQEIVVAHVAQLMNMGKKTTTNKQQNSSKN
jgi:hypothetical protein